MPLRLLLASLVALVALTASAGATTQRAATSPGVVHRGQVGKIVVHTPSEAVCLATVEYHDGAYQEGGVKYAHNGVVSWAIRVPTDAALGVAKWTVQCGVTWQKKGHWSVTAVASTGVAHLPQVVVDNQGFSQRSDDFGTGSSVSYGLLIHNLSTTEDAQNIYVLINFVDATGALLATVTKTVDIVHANTQYALGDSVELRTQQPVTKLEITLQVQAHQPAKAYSTPHFVNVQILPSTSDPGHVSEIDGEIVNDSSPDTLTMANISIVLENAAGAVVGGGDTVTFSQLPAGSRMVFLAQSGFSPVELDQAKTAIVSVDPTYAGG